MARLNLPAITRTILITALTLTTLNLLLRAQSESYLQTGEDAFIRKGNGAPYLSIVPNQSIKYPWVFLTATLVEQNLIGLGITGASLFFGGRYLERAWGEKEFIKFMIFVTMLPNIITFGLYVLFFALTKSEKALSTTISGGIAVQAAYLVSFKQLVPEHTVSLLKGMLRIRVKHFPSIFLLANTISAALFGTETAGFLAWFGFFTAWIYLRFFRISVSLSAAATGGDEATVKGDASDTFAFAQFFPEVVQPPISAISDAVYGVLVTLRLCTPFSAEDVEAGNEQASARAEGGLPSLMNNRGGRRGGVREDAERRRALALKALDQRLHAAASRGGPSSVRQPSQDSTASASTQGKSEPAMASQIKA